MVGIAVTVALLLHVRQSEGLACMCMALQGCVARIPQQRVARAALNQGCSNIRRSQAPWPLHPIG
jgi:hypothetical protein